VALHIVVIVGIGVGLGFEGPALATSARIRIAVVQFRVPNRVGVAATIHAITW
jgi:hypothetical protein